MEHFGFKCKNELGAWLSRKSNKSETIRCALTRMMESELRQPPPQPQQRTHYKPKSRAHKITSRGRVPRRGGFHSGKTRPNRFTEVKHIQRGRGICTSEEES